MTSISIAVLVLLSVLASVVQAWSPKFARKVAVVGLSVVSTFGAVNLPALAAAPNAVKPTFKAAGAEEVAGPVTVSGIVTVAEGVPVPETLSKALYIAAKPVSNSLL